MAKQSGNSATSGQGITVWKFARVLTCCLVHEPRDCVVVVNTERATNYLVKRFKHESQALSYAESLREKLLKTRWTAVAGPRPRLRGER